MTDAGELDLEQLASRPTDEFDQRLIEIGPFSELEQDAASWQDAIVFVRTGAIEIVCAGGGRGCFRRGDILCLARFSSHTVRNPSPEPARLLVISRRASSL